MYLNRITLIGFIGSDAERKAANSTNIAIFSLATKTSWKNDAGSWESRSESAGQTLQDRKLLISKPH